MSVLEIFISTASSCIGKTPEFKSTFPKEKPTLNSLLFFYHFSLCLKPNDIVSETCVAGSSALLHTCMVFPLTLQSPAVLVVVCGGPLRSLGVSDTNSATTRSNIVFGFCCLLCSLTVACLKHQVMKDCQRLDPLRCSVQCSPGSAVVVCEVTTMLPWAEHPLVSPRALCSRRQGI